MSILFPHSLICADTYPNGDSELREDAGLVTSSLDAARAELRKIRSDLKTAHDVQCRSLPSRLARIPGLDYHGECLPAGEVGGDFFDFIPLRNRAMVAAVGDVSGNGIGAALMMSSLQAFLRGLTGDGREETARVVRDLNRRVCEMSPDNFYASLFYARIDPLEQRLHFINAGHEPALLVRKRGLRAHRLESTGTVLGLTGHAAYRQRTMPLEPGDVLVLLTDGVTEAVDATGRELSDADVLDVVRRQPDARASQMVEQIVDAVDRFTNHSRPADDRTVAVVRFTGMERETEFESRAAEVAFAAA